MGPLHNFMKRQPVAQSFRFVKANVFLILAFLRYLKLNIIWANLLKSKDAKPWVLFIIFMKRQPVALFLKG